MKLSEQLREWSAPDSLSAEAADLLDECEKALEFIQQDDCGCDECNKARATLAKLRGE